MRSHHLVFVVRRHRGIGGLRLYFAVETTTLPFGSQQYFKSPITHNRALIGVPGSARPLADATKLTIQDFVVRLQLDGLRYFTPYVSTSVLLTCAKLAPSSITDTNGARVLALPPPGLGDNVVEFSQFRCFPTSKNAALATVHG